MISLFSGPLDRICGWLAVKAMGWVAQQTGMSLRHQGVVCMVVAWLCAITSAMAPPPDFIYSMMMLFSSTFMLVTYLWQYVPLWTRFWRHFEDGWLWPPPLRQLRLLGPLRATLWIVAWISLGLSLFAYHSPAIRHWAAIGYFGLWSVACYALSTHVEPGPKLKDRIKAWASSLRPVLPTPVRI